MFGGVLMTISVDVLYDQDYVTFHINRLRDFYYKKMMNRIVDEIDNDRLTFNKLFMIFLKNKYTVIVHLHMYSTCLNLICSFELKKCIFYSYHFLFLFLIE